MSRVASFVWLLSVGLLLLLSIRQFLLGGRRSFFVFNSLALLAGAALLATTFDIFGSPVLDRSRSDGSVTMEAAMIILLFLAMLLGMACAYFFMLSSRPKAKRPSFDLGLFLAPIFASPIIFIPLLASYGDIWGDFVLDPEKSLGAKLMVFVVAFENGFFWKVIFDRRGELVQAVSTTLHQTKYSDASTPP